MKANFLRPEMNLREDSMKYGRLAVFIRHDSAKILGNPPVVSDFCSNLRAPHRGTSLGPLVCGANKIEYLDY
jgi:hypothetical protein